MCVCLECIKHIWTCGSCGLQSGCELWASLQRMGGERGRKRGKMKVFWAFFPSFTPVRFILSSLALTQRPRPLPPVIRPACIRVWEQPVLHRSSLQRLNPHPAAEQQRPLFSLLSRLNVNLIVSKRFNGQNAFSPVLVRSIFGHPRLFFFFF